MQEELFFKKVCGQESRKFDILFIHGLTGDPKETWTSEAGDYWPSWLCEDFPGASVYSLGYPASLFEKWAKKEMDLFERAGNALEYVVAKGIGERPLVIIAHSLGGILAKQIVRCSRDAEDDDWKKVAPATKLVVFLATPHTGAALAGVIKAAVPHFASKSVELLSNDSGILTDINTSYRSFANASSVKTVVYYEKHKTKNATLVVSKESADPGVAGTTPVAVDKDHISICKPIDRDDIIYAGIQRHLRNLDASLPATSGAFNEEGYADKSDHDRRDLLTKLIAANLEHEYDFANNYQNKFAQNYLRLGLYTAERDENDKLLSEVEQRFTTHVYHPLICKNASDDKVRSALQTHVIDPICEKRKDHRNFSEKTVLSALYYLTEQCHVRWDAKA